MARLLPLAMVAVLAAGAAFAQPAPERKLEGHALISAREPAVKIEVPSSLSYIGADRWPLYNVADCEAHVFAETGADGTVRRLVWIQFEGYLPEKPEAHYGYNSPRHATLGGLDFFVDLYPRQAGDPTQAGSDREHVDALLKARGARLAPGMMYARLVHLLDDQKRRELMIIYGEPLPDPALSAADVAKGGKAETQWGEMSDGLLARALKALVITP